MSASVLKSEIMERSEHLSAHIGRQMAPAEQEYAQLCVHSLAGMVYQDIPIFTVEHWHGLEDFSSGPAEMLLRLRDEQNEPLAPYPFVMSCYNSGLTSLLDSLLLVSALYEYAYFHREQGEKAVSINLSSKFLEERHAEYAEDIFYVMDFLNIGEGITFEIHESSSSAILSRRIMDQFYARGVRFAIDDVKANVQDILRLASFKNYVNYIKLDRSLVLESENDPVFFGGMIDFFRGHVPGVQFVAEGVQTTAQARHLFEAFKHIHFVQGRDLPGRERFQSSWIAASA